MIGNIHRLWFSSVTVKTYDVTMRYTETNLLRTSWKTLDWNSNFQVDFQSIHFYIDYINASLLNLMSCIDLVSYYESLSCKKFFYSLLKHKCIETQLWKGISIQCFRRRPQQVNLPPLHCDVKCFDCDRRKSQTM